jgi:tRNA1Val (adenine37-N6)-methyltransferase
MANSYFQFKQFIVHQDKSAMKVCTDACLFGAWVGNRLASLQLPLRVALDIGTGTGLLSLLLAQALPITIDAVEIEADAYQQAFENISISPWKYNISVIHENINAYHPTGKYGLIISNPPFYENDLKASGSAKNLARHEGSIQLGILFYLAGKWLSEGGYFALMLPAHRTKMAIDAGNEHGFTVYEETLVKQTTSHSPFRVMLLFSNGSCVARQSVITIKENGNYSTAFKNLLEPFYL